MVRKNNGWPKLIDLLNIDHSKVSMGMYSLADVFFIVMEEKNRKVEGTTSKSCVIQVPPDLDIRMNASLPQTVRVAVMIQNL